VYNLNFETSVHHISAPSNFGFSNPPVLKHKKMERRILDVITGFVFLNIGPWMKIRKFSYTKEQAVLFHRAPASQPAGQVSTTSTLPFHRKPACHVSRDAASGVRRDTVCVVELKADSKISWQLFTNPHFDITRTLLCFRFCFPVWYLLLLTSLAWGVGSRAECLL
jgi:hypothetical protein